MNTRYARIAYVGSMGAGRTTSLIDASRRSGGDPDWRSVSDAKDQQLVLERDGVQWNLTIFVSWVRGWLSYSDPLDPSLDPRVIQEIERLALVDGIVFVVDARSFRWEAAIANLKKLRSDLVFRGRDLETIPIVFQVNWLDDPDARSMDDARQSFTTTQCAHIESIATKGRGTLEALMTLLTMIPS